MRPGEEVFTTNNPRKRVLKLRLAGENVRYHKAPEGWLMWRDPHKPNVVVTMSEMTKKPLPRCPTCGSDRMCLTDTGKSARKVHKARVMEKIRLTAIAPRRIVS